MDAASTDHVEFRLLGIICDPDRTFELGEAATDLADHEVAGHELDRRVRRVEDVFAGDRDLDPLVVAGGARFRSTSVCRSSASSGFVGIGCT